MHLTYLKRTTQPHHVRSPIQGAAAGAGTEAAGRQHTGYRPGDPAYRRVAGALFAAGVATFALMYSTQALLPEPALPFPLSEGDSTLSLSLTTAGLGVTLLFTGP